MSLDLCKSRETFVFVLTRYFLFVQLIICLIGVNPVFAEDAQKGNPPGNPINHVQQLTPEGGDSSVAPFSIRRLLTRFEFWLSLLIIAFGCVVVAVQYALLRKRNFDGNDILKVFGVTLIIVGTLFLISAGFGDKQIASAMGLFGTLAGYLLGRASVEPPTEEKP
jgi:hypothetical protein